MRLKIDYDPICNINDEVDSSIIHTNTPNNIKCKTLTIHLFIYSSTYKIDDAKSMK